MDDSYAYDIEEELVAVIPSQQNWKGIGISLVVILSVIGLVALTVYWMTPPDTGPRIRGARISLQNFSSGIFQTSSLNATWFSDSELAYIDSFGNLVLYNAVTGARSLLVSANIFRSVGSSMYHISPDANWILIETQPVLQSFFNTAQYSIWNIPMGITSPQYKVSISGDSSWGYQEQLQSVLWAGGSGGVVVVKENDIYYRPYPDKKEVVRVTDSGIPGTIFNGAPDWLYKERILGSRSGIWVSPDHMNMVYSSINCSRVGLLRYPHILNGEASVKDLSIKFPKVGGNIPEIRLHFYNFQTFKGVEILPPSQLQNRSYYVESIGWSSNNEVLITWLSRQQDLRFISHCSTLGACTQTFFEHASNYGLETLPHTPFPPIVNRGQDMIAYISLKREGDEGYYPHILVRSLVDPGAVGPRLLTHGPWKVHKILGWDPKINAIYFLGSDPSFPASESQHLYRQPLDQEEKSSTGGWSSRSTGGWSSRNGSSTSECLTCSAGCQFSEIFMSPDLSNFIQHCLGPSIPYSQVICASTGVVVQVLDENKKLQYNIDKFSTPKYKIITVPTGEETNAVVKLDLPPGFREYEEYTFPLIMYIGEVFPSINSKWSMHWTDYITSHKDYIVAQVEVGLRGGENETRLGMRAQEDILKVLRYLTRELRYVDRSKVGLVGEGGGGYTAGMVLGLDLETSIDKQNPTTKCSVFISPTVDWKLSDAFISEHLLGHKKNRFETSSVSLHSSLYPSKRVFITNKPGNLVSLDHLLALTRALVHQGVIFKQQIYLDSEADPNSMIHFYKSIEAHLEDCLGPVENFFQDDYFLATIADISAG